MEQASRAGMGWRSMGQTVDNSVLVVVSGKIQTVVAGVGRVNKGSQDGCGQLSMGWFVGTSITEKTVV
jgi:hypothetical protein